MNVVAWVTTVCCGASPLLLGQGGEAGVNPPALILVGELSDEARQQKLGYSGR